jgi:hypothetical protein
MIGTSIK